MMVFGGGKAKNQGTTDVYVTKELKYNVLK